MSNPFSLTIAGVNGGANLITLPNSATPSVPFMDTSSFSGTLTGDGSASLAFEIIEPITPGAGPWWRSGGVNDNAVVKLFDSRYSGSTPIFLGYLVSVTGELLPNGVGTRCAVSVAGATDWINKTIVRKGLSGSDIYQQVGAFSIGKANSTDRDIINALLQKVHNQVNDSTTREILDTSVISGSTRAVFTGAAVTIGKQSFKPGPLLSALDQVAEEASGECGSAIRYVVNNVGRLEYGAKSKAGNISFANAPAQVSTEITVPTVGGTAAATVVFADNLSVSLDHQQIIKGIFVEAADTRADRDANARPITNAPYFRTYNGSTATFSGAGLSTRSGPLPQQVFSASKVGAYGFGSRKNKVQRLTRATFQVKAQPMRTVSFTISGAYPDQTSDPDWSYGITQGYAETASSTFDLVKAWLPDQYVKVIAPSLGISPSEILRISSVTFKFQSGSTYALEYQIEADFPRRKFGDDLRRIIGG
jgi:hypothetical protein